MSAVAELRAATSSSHRRLEKRLNVKTRFTELGAYRGYLEKLWGFIAGLEQALSAESFGSALPDYDARRKLPLLTRDLIALGGDRRSVYLLPRCPMASALLDPAAAFGCAYVLEGATLGGITLLPLVAERLGFSADHGAVFLASYGAEIPSMWHQFCAALDAWCCVPERRASASEAAVVTFDSLAVWLCGTPS